MNEPTSLYQKYLCRAYEAFAKRYLRSLSDEQLFAKGRALYAQARDTAPRPVAQAEREGGQRG